MKTLEEKNALKTRRIARFITFSIALAFCGILYYQASQDKPADNGMENTSTIADKNSKPKKSERRLP